LNLLNFIIKTIKNKKKKILCILKVTEDFGTDPDPLVKGRDPRIRICIKMSRIRNTAHTSHEIMPEEQRLPEFGRADD
jgi:hypothetical protein